ncbi:MAG: T9SS type A sorting domain-containing protein, partial [Bacteroidota bacterium]
RVVGDADDAWDAYDFSKPLPPSGSYAVVAPVGERDGETRYQAVLSVPAARTVPVAFQANEAGTYELSGVLTGGLQATLVDLETGAEHDLSSGAYAFEQGATFFRDRFEVRLSGGSVSTDEDAPETEVGVPYPNPVNGAARLSVRASESGVIAVDLFDTLGRRVARTVAPSSAGSAQHIDLPTNDLAPGVYTVRVSGAGLSAVRSLTVAR